MELIQLENIFGFTACVVLIFKKNIFLIFKNFKVLDY